MLLWLLKILCALEISLIHNRWQLKQKQAYGKALELISMQEIVHFVLYQTGHHVFSLRGLQFQVISFLCCRSKAGSFTLHQTSMCRSNSAWSEDSQRPP